MTRAGPTRIPTRVDAAESIREASADDVLAIVAARAEALLGGNVCNEAYAEDQGGLVHLFMGGHPADGFDDAFANAEIDRLAAVLAPLGWFVGKRERTVADDSPARLLAIEDGDAVEDEEPQTMWFVDALPLEGPAYERHEPILWHASPASNRDAILRDGIAPAMGGNDHMSFPHPRLHVATHAMSLEHLETDMARSRRWRDLDLWMIDAASLPDHRWRVDVEMEGVSIWTDAPIPASALRLEGALAGMHSGGWRRLPTRFREVEAA